MPAINELPLSDNIICGKPLLETNFDKLFINVSADASGSLKLDLSYLHMCE